MTERLHTTRYYGPSHKPTQDYVDSAEESRSIIRDYVQSTLADGKYPDGHDFAAQNNTPSIRWDIDAVDTEIERIIDAETLRKDIRDYVKSGGWDALSFAMLASPRYDRVPGREIQRTIDTEREALN